MFDKNNTNSFNKNIHTLRGIAVILILLYHIFLFQEDSKNFIKQGELRNFANDFFIVGVPLFFFISGFVLLNSTYSLKPTIINNSLAFLKRLLRIQIPTTLNILITWAILIILNYFFSWKLEQDLFYPQRFLANIFFYVPFTNYSWYNVIYWTMTIEIQFYILFFILFTFVKNKSILVYSIILLVVSFSFFDDIRFITHYFPLFALGMLLSLYLSSKISFYLYVFGFLYTICFGFAYLELNWMISVSIASLLCVFFTIKSQIIDFFSKISFSLYLTQGVTAILFLTIAPFKEDSSLWIKIVYGVLAFIIATVGAWLFYLIIEKPSIKLLKKILH